MNRYITLLHMCNKNKTLHVNCISITILLRLIMSFSILQMIFTYNTFNKNEITREKRTFYFSFFWQTGNSVGNILHGCNKIRTK